jgi:hypothetical protein
VKSARRPQPRRVGVRREFCKTQIDLSPIGKVLASDTNRVSGALWCGNKNAWLRKQEALDASHRLSNPHPPTVLLVAPNTQFIKEFYDQF